MNEFILSFKRSSTVSIDSFISQSDTKEFQQIAKVLTTLIILSFSVTYEQYSSNDEWIEYYFHRRFDWNENFHENLPTVISLNYDNLFIRKLLEYIFRARQLEASKIIENWFSDNFISIHGCFDYKLNEHFFDGSLSEGDISSLLIENYESINFLRPGKKNAKIEKVIKQSKNVYILGYGFDRLNNKILFKNERYLLEVINTKMKAISTLNMPQSYIDQFNETLRMNVDRFSIRQLEEGDKCRDALQKGIPLPLFPDEV